MKGAILLTADSIALVVFRHGYPMVKGQESAEIIEIMIKI
jgi:hypothetical protein